MKVPSWLGFVIGILIGIVLFVIGVVGVLGFPASYYFMSFGVFFFVACIFCWIVGATSDTGLGDGGIWVTIGNMPWWAWIVVIVLFIAAIVVPMFL